MKLPQPSAGAMAGYVRRSTTFEAGPGTPPAPALDLVRAFVRHDARRRSPCGCRRSDGRRGCSTPDGDRVAEVVDDEVVGAGRSARRGEVPRARGGVGRRDRRSVLRVRLRSAARRREREPAETALAKHVRALQPRIDPASRRDHDRATSRRTRPSRRWCGRRSRLLGRAADPQRPGGSARRGRRRVSTRRGSPPGGSVRICARSGRSLDPDRDADLREELGGSATSSAPVRDLDVLGERLRAHVAALPDSDAGVGAQAVRAAPGSARGGARRAAVGDARGPRTSALLDRARGCGERSRACPTSRDRAPSSSRTI